MSLIPPEKLQKLRAALHAKAKALPNQRFHALYDKVYRSDVLAHAYACCKANGGAAGIDDQTFADIEDRVVQTAAMLVLEPIFEADLQPEQYAYRAERSALDAVNQVRNLLNGGYTHVVDADLSGYFDSIPHAELMRCLARRIVDGAMLHLLTM